ncbi:MAG: hypothetical protein A3C79_00355 [Candidatus Taylorbacteria bacterium RIFCSPHIGHO2_02_FULL_45_28]|uniref:Methyltransferase type 11 domain-containing protein n=1 Tax=Candidatus Taylorbacteria bacterium RIFCSPHIGHO2_12_FULL_45_16 TaxID=1802315 RepID=A0A1G2MZC5_9BACT|nr:MAG: hypothetical protein A2830_01610 [Candidatus Taylorbacteria bacterium RIFCSPHIGHO2_01_FULL_44_110]OHA25476.1 MAG: hypothetical protein A3C79_00355 [Candidatus Taylorbacteria bacterium RIFCSPHIGHO2_02_FULL_45_28]OHA29143.1 MAG: hypothetical protein A3F51_00820 [Candidatus Taylorbacteria bacterium RIFCSPHIGHO2_12_FULL_45_16]OHA33365.1 MAG: hypothetical protein A3A23_01700 [Candidatus Taylorbacteria bacterium RIFCSPLOWO2_01_FULL_45_59]OHA39878.1 MAG: hypothetical protein A3I98_01740 [Candi
MKPNTSWGGVVEWYNDLLEQDSNSFQKNVLMPNLIRIVGPKTGMNLLDVACGQGYFSRAFAANGATVIGCDISQELIGKARGFKDPRDEDKSMPSVDFSKKDFQKSGAGKVGPVVTYNVSPADRLSFATDSSFDVVTIVLALQNIENLAGTLTESARVLKNGGRLVIVVNHPAFRIPQRSDWGWDEIKKRKVEIAGKKEWEKIVGPIPEQVMYRRLDGYMSDSRVEIDMTPGEKITAKKKFTISFHRPLQSYFKALSKAGFAVTRLEEWVSHKNSQTGPRATEEDRMRKEIPMFLCLETVKL